MRVGPADEEWEELKAFPLAPSHLNVQCDEVAVWSDRETGHRDRGRSPGLTSRKGRGREHESKSSCIVDWGAHGVVVVVAPPKGGRGREVGKDMCGPWHHTHGRWVKLVGVHMFRQGSEIGTSTVK